MSKKEQEQFSNEETSNLSFDEDLEEEQPKAFSIDRLSKEEQSTIADQIDKQREDTRSKLAQFFLCILGGTYLLSFVLMVGVIVAPFFWEQEEFDQQLRNDTYTYTKDIISIFITTQTGLVGSIMGFYFGSNQALNQSKNENQ